MPFAKQTKGHLTELQVQAYLERHGMDQLLEDLLASVIEHMPAYPLPFMISLIKRRAGVQTDSTTTATNYKAMLDDSLAEHQRTMQQTQADHDGAVQRMQIDHENKLHALTLRQASLEESLAGATAKIKTSDADLDAAQQKLAGAAQSGAVLDELKATLSAEKKRNAELDAGLTKAKVAEAKLRETVGELQRVTSQLEKTEQQLQQARSKVETGRVNSDDRASQLSKEKAALEAQLEASKRDQAAQDRIKAVAKFVGVDGERN